MNHLYVSGFSGESYTTVIICGALINTALMMKSWVSTVRCVMRRMCVVVALVALVVGCEAKQPEVHTETRQETKIETDKAGLIKSKISRLVETRIKELKSDPKIVVADNRLDVTITREEEDELFSGVEWLPTLSRGASTVSVLFEDNKVQYIVRPKDLKFKVEGSDVLHKVIITSKPPVLDEEIVEVQSNPAKLKVKMDVGWSHLESGRGQEMLKRVKGAARDEVVKSGKTKKGLDFAQGMAGKTLRGLFEPALEALGKNIVVEVRFAP